jgi:hypothetical protein
MLYLTSRDDDPFYDERVVGSAANGTGFRAAALRAAENCFVSGHGFSRAVNA